MLQKEKLSQATNILHELDVDMWVTVGRETSMNNDPVLPLISTIDFASLSALIVTPGGVTVLTGHMDADGARQTGVYEDVRAYDKSFKEVFFDILKEYNPKQIALNYSTKDVASDGLSYGMYLQFMNFLEEANYTGEVISAENIIGKLRGVKSPEEKKRINEAIEIAEKIFEDARGYIKAGVSEIDIYNYFQERLKYYGVESGWHPDHCPGVMLGPDTVMGHNAPTDLKAKKGDAITVDFGVRKEGYCTDMQRVYYLREDHENSVPEEVQKTFEVIQEAVRRGMAAMKPGVKGFEVDKVARDYVLSMGYPNFNFGFGHQVGRKAHDGGLLMAPQWDRYKGANEQELEEDMIFTVDVNLPTSRGNVGQEDMAIVTKDGGVYISKKQEEIFLI